MTELPDIITYKDAQGNVLSREDWMDLTERLACTKAGQSGHHGCGQCPQCSTLRAQCGHLQFTHDEGEES